MRFEMVFFHVMHFSRVMMPRYLSGSWMKLQQLNVHPSPSCRTLLNRK